MELPLSRAFSLQAHPWIASLPSWVLVPVSVEWGDALSLPCSHHWSVCRKTMSWGQHDAKYPDVQKCPDGRFHFAVLFILGA